MPTTLAQDRARQRHRLPIATARVPATELADQDQAREYRHSLDAIPGFRARGLTNTPARSPSLDELHVADIAAICATTRACPLSSGRKKANPGMALLHLEWYFWFMKALVLSGGSGSRLRPITHTNAKQLLPVANKPVLFYGLEAIRDCGIVDVGVVVGNTARAVQQAVGDGSAFGLNVTYIQQDAPTGLAHAVLIAREFIGDDDFVMYLGDNFIVGGINSLVDEFRSSRPDAHIMLTRVSEPRQFGVAELNDSGEIIGLEEKPTHPKSDLALVGVYIFTRAIHEAVRHLVPSWRGELEITEAIQWLIDSGCKVRSTTITGYWKDTGNVSDMLEVNRLVLESLNLRVEGLVDEATELIGRVVIETGAHVNRSRIVGPVIIGAGTRVSDSYIGPFTSVANDCVISDSEIEYSIVLHGASIQGVRRIDASLIGHHVMVTPSPRAPKAHRLILGDHSQVQISS
jgi:glucose-1-phosphate thymidylyltransferase